MTKFLLITSRNKWSNVTSIQLRSEKFAFTLYIFTHLGPNAAKNKEKLILQNVPYVFSQKILCTFPK